MTLWLVDSFGRGGIARYTADVANLCPAELSPIVATTTQGPAPALTTAHRIWFPGARRGVAGKVLAAAIGWWRAMRSIRRGDLVWLALGVRPLYELLLAWSCRARGATVIGTVHNRGPHDAEKPSPLVVLAARACRRCVVHTSSLAAWGRALSLPIAQLPFPRPFGGRPPRAGCIGRQTLGAADDDILVAMIGNLLPYKGVDTLVAGLAEARRRDPSTPLRAILAGQVRQDHDPRRMAMAHGVADRVVVRNGYVPDGELVDILDAADVLALPYRRIDHSGVGALALVTGTPMVATDLANLRDLLGDRATYFPAGDTAALAEALLAVPRRPKASAVDEPSDGAGERTSYAAFLRGMQS